MILNIKLLNEIIVILFEQVSVPDVFVCIVRSGEVASASSILNSDVVAT